VIDHLSYGSFGDILSESSPANGDKFKFDGMQYDDALGIYYVNARWYDQASGKFVSKDPMGFGAGDADLSRFAGNDPTDVVDPSGLDGMWAGFFNYYYGNYTPTPPITFDPRGTSDPLDTPGLNAGFPRIDPTAVDANGRLGMVPAARARMNAVNGIGQMGAQVGVDLAQQTLERGVGKVVDKGIEIAGDIKWFKQLPGPGPSSGKPPLWTATKDKTGIENAYGHFKKHGAEFPEYPNAMQYAQGARSFVNNPAAGTLTKVRPNGDKLFFDPATNTFAVQRADGALRTMFRPADGINYWSRQ
jgi:RHS repeat-associated protein